MGKIRFESALVKMAFGFLVALSTTVYPASIAPVFGEEL
jgi:hypothetical protein